MGLSVEPCVFLLFVFYAEITEDDINDWDYDSDRTPLLQCVESRNLPLMKALLERGADYDAVTDDYETILEMAAEKGYLDVIDVSKL